MHPWATLLGWLGWLAGWAGWLGWLVTYWLGGDRQKKSWLGQADGAIPLQISEPEKRFFPFTPPPPLSLGPATAPSDYRPAIVEYLLLPPPPTVIPGTALSSQPQEQPPDYRPPWEFFFLTWLFFPWTWGWFPASLSRGEPGSGPGPAVYIASRVQCTSTRPSST
ncbi:hypothetical protein BGZ61DRAFT_438182 [Ilyonectria robusta]|uniref:uncharacterized protein n=1 Tax=Ilyonectria robusta TaxID=1079257 RepID=UPI001E8DD77F|nr:uncharacterized protein BGZ61DRAFT_438182 [Ilyonectria robusta]KAH8737355.1 hypothetical protein BGZ61DRAFT_438182 [Ilyonectria robusta]